MSRLYNDYRVMCPFYKSEERTDINCEGVVADTTTQLCFTKRQPMLQYKLDYCCEKWYACAIAKGLGTKY